MEIFVPLSRELGVVRGSFLSCSTIWHRNCYVVDLKIGREDGPTGKLEKPSLITAPYIVACISHTVNMFINNLFSAGIIQPLIFVYNKHIPTKDPMFKLHHTIGTFDRLPLGNFTIHGLIFADDGFGNFQQVDTLQYVTFLISD